MSRFVQVPFGEFDTFMQSIGCKRLEAPRGSEIVYERTHDHDPALVVRIYSSFANGADTARSCGEDAIRIVLSVNGRGVWSCPKVLRTGSVQAVLERTRERAREAYAMANAMRKAPRCSRCQGYCYPDSNKCVRYRECGGYGARSAQRMA